MITIKDYKKLKGTLGKRWKVKDTSKYRRWICLRCNLVLGHVKDDPALLKNLVNI